MTKAECKMKLKHQLEIGRRLQVAGLYEAATESRIKAQILLLAYKRHYAGIDGQAYQGSHPLDE